MIGIIETANHDAEFPSRSNAHSPQHTTTAVADTVHTNRRYVLV